MLSLLLMLGSLSPGTPTSECGEGAAPIALESNRQDWRSTWQNLDRLRDSALDGEERARLRERLGDWQRAQAGSPRAAVLRVLLARWDGGGVDVSGCTATELGLEGGEGSPELEPDESWYFAEALEQSSARVAQVVAALDAAPPGETHLSAGRRLNLAWQVGVDEARAGRHADGALPIQRRLHELYPAAWSAMDLALTLGLLGLSVEADTVLESEIDRQAARGAQGDGNGRIDPELWNRRGLVQLGLGHERRARDYFGRAIRLGSTNSAVVLARLDLARGDLEEARRGFRALSWGADPGAWTQRGYGLALLPPRPRRSQHAR